MEFKEFNTYLNIYKRKNLDQFLKYIKENCEGTDETTIEWYYLYFKIYKKYNKDNFKIF